MIAEGLSVEGPQWVEDSEYEYPDALGGADVNVEEFGN